MKAIFLTTVPPKSMDPSGCGKTLSLPTSHCGLRCCSGFNQWSFPFLRTIEYQSYKHFDINAFKRDLEGVPWHVIENEDNIDDAICTWNKLFSDTADSHAPVKRRRVWGVLLPWMNTKINEAMQDRDYHHRKAIKLSSPFHWTKYIFLL